MDIKAEIEKVVDKIKADPDFAKEFSTDPVKAVEKVLGIDLPDDLINKVIDGVKAKIAVSDINNKLGGILNAFKK